jgi:hypothetical protein
MANLVVPGQGLVFMKVGVHANEDLVSIIRRKTQEIEEAGFALWGYGGSTCYPNSMVQPFAKDCASRGQRVYLCMHEMESNHFADQIRADEFSIDGDEWKVIPPAINVLGSRFALAIKALRKEEFVLPLSHTRVAVGPSMGRPGNRYIQGRADKACLEITDGVAGQMAEDEPKIEINLVAELCEPYAVFLRNKPE